LFQSVLLKPLQPRKYFYYINLWSTGDINPKVAADGRGSFRFKMPVVARADIICCISYIFEDKNFKQKAHAEE
jgi:hypothetical protein